MFVTITAMDYFFGSELLKVDMECTAKKEPNNDMDAEAIAVYNKDNIKIGYIANSISTVAKGTRSAGRVYDTFDKETTMIIEFIPKGCAIAEIKTQS